MGDCEKGLDLDLDYKPPQAEEEEEEKKKEKIKSSSSSSHASDHDDDDDHHHATNIETLVGDLQSLSLKGNENNNNNNHNNHNNHNQIDDNPDASDQEDPVTSTNETLEGGELLQNHLIISSEEGSGETLEGEFQNHLVTSEGEGVKTRMISQISTNLVRFFKKEKNDDNKPVASDDHGCSTITTTTTTSTIETTLDGGELQNLSLVEGKEENQRDHKPDDDIKTQTLDGELHNLSSEWNGTPNDHPTTIIETLDGELHNPEVETNPSSEWDKLHNPEVETNPSSEWDDGWDGTQKDNPEVETNPSSEWDDGWDGTQKDNPEVETNLSSEWVDGTQKDKPEVETIFKEEKRRTFQYPLRPEEPDCVFYLRTGSCRYGFQCKFNHPPRKKNQLKASSHLSDSSVQRLEPITAIEVVKEKEREREDYKEWTGKIECKYYRTPGGCKFGKACKYYHPQEKNVVDPPTEFNFLGLPIRPGEKKCPFFMRTGSCKFATSCRFHHPDPTDAVESDPLSGYHDAESVELHSEGSPQPHVTSWSLPGTYNETALYMDTSSSYPTGMVSPYNETAPYMDTSSSYPTGMVSPSQAHHNREWNGYQVPVRYSPEGNRNPQSASLMNHSTRKANNSMHQQQQQMVVDEFPERPGQHECQYYMKHGDCKYRSACRFHHPKNYSTNSPVLSSIGLPLRPDQIICSNYSRFGICKYGPACKYDHPA